MNPKIRTGFLILVLAQGLHSIEEYSGKLWEVLPPAKFLSGLVSSNLRTGFTILNIGLFVFGICCWFYCFRRNAVFAQNLIWFWIVIELINGIGHSFWCLYERAYVPGIITSPILFVLAIYLFRQLLYPKFQSSG